MHKNEIRPKSLLQLLQIQKSEVLIGARKFVQMKRAMFLMGGLLWVGFALGFGVFLLGYLGGGAGLQFFGGPVSSGSVFLGLVHLVGFGTAMLICFAVGAGLFARGMVKDTSEQ
jgi:hypothetical protein